ncbi:hypothetical protein [Xenorhabdus hominickii]|uniref:FAD-dependent oxidoreductase n=1 Tax=Xenorhabdus hominickii TaxID=351679 RepID=A0A2G0Q484_XENHO|nr:hypothetical protein [Xenorhabdus hominickii]PHM54029.1 FAD-dependent oxidoreductase [Xenorhabdus hominickii]
MMINLSPLARRRFSERMRLPQVAEHAVVVANEVLHVPHLTKITQCPVL